MKKIFLALLLVTGLGLVVSGSWIQVKAELAQWLLNDAWNRTAMDGQVHKPWFWADHWPVARLKVKAHDIKQIVLAGDSGSVLAFAPGLNTRLAAPGQAGTSVISGHRDTHFRFLEHLKAGETIDIELPGSHSSYRVTKTEVVDSRQFAFDPEAISDHGSNQLLLVTCYPFDAMTAGGPLRYVVTADPVML